MNKQIIAFTGHSQCGKDTAGKYLTDKHHFVRVSFADAVREALLAVDPLVIIAPEESKSVDNLMGVLRLSILVNKVGWETAKKAKEVRELLQRMGTEAGRHVFGDSIWIDIAHKKTILYDKIVFTDVRFENEARFVQRLGGKVVRINRAGVGSINSHVSDKRLDDSLVDIEIYNNSTVLDLFVQVEELLNDTVEVKAAA